MSNPTLPNKATPLFSGVVSGTHPEAPLTMATDNPALQGLYFLPYHKDLAALLADA